MEYDIKTVAAIPDYGGYIHLPLTKHVIGHKDLGLKTCRFSCLFFARFKKLFAIRPYQKRQSILGKCMSQFHWVLPFFCFTG